MELADESGVAPVDFTATYQGWAPPDPVPSEILTGCLFLGCRKHACDARKENPCGLTHVLNVSDIPCLLPGQHEPKLVCKHVSISDDGGDRIFRPHETDEDYKARAEIDPAARRQGQYWACRAFITETLKDPGNRVLVHCSAGVNRSATIVAAWLMETQQWPAWKALRHIQRRRPFINPVYGHREQLAGFQMKLGIKDEKHFCKCCAQ